MNQNLSSQKDNLPNNHKFESVFNDFCGPLYERPRHEAISLKNLSTGPIRNNRDVPGLFLLTDVLIDHEIRDNPLFNGFQQPR